MQIQIPSHIKHEAQSTSTKFRLTCIEDIKDTIVTTLRDIIGREVDDDEPLIAQGLDSLAAMELRKRMQVQCLICKARMFCRKRCYMTVIMKDCLTIEMHVWHWLGLHAGSLGS